MLNSPVISPMPGQSVMSLGRYQRLYNNPMFDYLSEMLPQNVKDMFRWCELVYHSMPVISNGIRKLVNYPVTNFSFNDDSKTVRDETRKLVEQLHLRSALLDLGTDRYVYGNGFRSLYFPFKRFLECSRCHNRIAISNAKFRIRKKFIELKCSCGWSAPAKIVDEASDDLNKIRIVRWDPKQLELMQNPITGSTTYYYTLPQSYVRAVRRGDLTVLEDSPEIFVRAALAGKNVVMGNNFFHSKTTTLSGFASGWGISPLMPTLKTYMYVSVLRKASEAIGMEHITPQRILFPQSNGTSDPSVMGSMERWKIEVNKALERWRIDPNYVMTAPFPTGVTNIGSQGRALSPIDEIKDARNEIALALDIPPNILMGDATIQASAVGLRILENQLSPVTESLQDFANWVIDMINAQYGRSYCHAKLMPFRLADDVMSKQLLLQAMGQAVSKSTVQEALALDPDNERERLTQEALDDREQQKEIEDEIKRREQNTAAQAQDDAEAMSSGDMPMHNQQKMMQLAQQYVTQLMSMPYEQRKSALAQLQNQSYIMWAVVSKQMESAREQMPKNGPAQ